MAEVPQFQVPDYRFEQVITPERRQEVPPLDEGRIHDFSEAIQGEMDDIWEVNIGRENQGIKDWPKIFQTMAEYGQTDVEFLEETLGSPLTGIEKDMSAAFWGMGENFRQMNERLRLEWRYEKARKTQNQAELQQVQARLDKLNIRAAEWQNQVAKTILALRPNAEGRRFLEFFWQTYEDIGKLYLPDDYEEIDRYRSGILGLISAGEVLRNLGLEVYRTHPEQDALCKIDLWAQKGKVILALQVKGRQGPDSISCQQITRFRSSGNRELKERREIDEDNRLLTSARQYGTNWRSEGHKFRVVPFRLTLQRGGTMATISQDPVDGTLTLPSDLYRSKFAEDLLGQVKAWETS